jgi:PAS domain S-box-containing protein
MQDHEKTKEQLIDELNVMRRRVAEFEAAEARLVGTKKSLKDSEAHFRRMFEKHSALMLLIEPMTGQILDANKAAERFYGYNISQLRSMSIQDINILAPDEVAHERILALQEKRNYFNFLHRLANGEVRTVEVHSTPIERGEEMILFSIIHDITERKRAEDALKGQKQRFQSLGENSPFGIVMIQPDGTFSYVNPKFKEMFGYDHSDVPNGREWFRKAYPDPGYRHEIISTWVENVKASAPGETRPHVFSVTCKDGSEKIVNFRPVKLDSGEDLMTCEDITDLKHMEEELRISEEKFSKAFHLNPCAVSISRLVDGMFVSVNEGFRKILGYAEEEVIGKTALELNIWDNPEDRKKVIELLKANGSVDNFEFSSRTKDGDIRYGLM